VQAVSKNAIFRAIRPQDEGLQPAWKTHGKRKGKRSGEVRKHRMAAEMKKGTV
jgi:hypothetical protein